MEEVDEYVHQYLQTLYILDEDLKFISAEGVWAGKPVTSP